MTPSSTLQVRRMTAAIGASVEGVDLRRLDDATFAIVRQAFLDNCVVVFRGQNLDPDSQIAFGRRFGELVHTEGSVNHSKENEFGALRSHPEILRIRNTGRGINWHTDNCHVPKPTAISILAAQQLPPVGGDTIFSNQYLAYETLSPGYKRMLRGMRLKHTGSSQTIYRGKPASEIPFHYHPLVRTHPDTGRRTLFLGGRVSPARPHYEGMTEQESQPIQQYLLEHSTQPDRCYRHQWRDGDVLMWDNRCTLHFAVYDYGKEVRDMNRVTIEGDIPFEAPYED